MVGSRMAVQPPRNALRRYRCKEGTRGGAVNCHATLSSSAVEPQVFEQVAGVLESTTIPVVRKHLEHAWAGLQHDGADRNQQRQRQLLERRVEQAKARIVKATEQLLDGKLGQDAYDMTCAKQRYDADVALQELRGLNLPPRRDTPDQRPLERVLRDARDWAMVLADTSDVNAQRDVLALLVERVTAERVSHGVYTVRVTWTDFGKVLAECAGLEVAAGA
jgi:hypothetical protein